jgi:outer membrane protein, heavy metal efflux system
MMKKLFFILTLLSANLMQAQVRTNQISLTLPEVDKIFLNKNLSLMAKRYDVDQAKALLIQARLFDNPVISFSENVYNNLNKRYFDFGKESEQTISVEQEIKLAGQRNKRILLAKVNGDISQFQFEELLRTLHSELHKQFVDLYFSIQSAQVYDKEINSLSVLVQAFFLQQSKGNISLMQKARLEAELLVLKKEKNEIEDQLISDRQELNLLLGLSTSSMVVPIIDEKILKQAPAITFESVDSVLNTRPDLKLSEANIKAAKANLSLQKALAAPNFSVQGSYDRAGGFIKNYFAMGVGVSIPIFDRNQGNIKAAKLNVDQSYKENEEAVQNAHSQLYSAYSQWENALALYKSSDSTTVGDNFAQLLAGAVDNFKKRNINMLEFLDYYESYKNTFLQLCDARKNVFLKMEEMNEAAGKSIFEY